MQSERTNDNSMITVRTRCRVIGVINCILSVVGVVVYLLIIVGITIGKEEYYAETKKGNMSIKDMAVNCILLQIWILSLLSYTNYRLSNRNTPSDGRAIKQWMLYHSLCAVYVILSTIISLIYNKNNKEFEYTTCAVPSIVIIILLIELYIVQNFKNEIASSGVENQPSSA